MRPKEFRQEYPCSWDDALLIKGRQLGKTSTHMAYLRWLADSFYNLTDGRSTMNTDRHMHHVKGRIMRAIATRLAPFVAAIASSEAFEEAKRRSEGHYTRGRMPASRRDLTDLIDSRVADHVTPTLSVGIVGLAKRWGISLDEAKAITEGDGFPTPGNSAYFERMVSKIFIDPAARINPAPAPEPAWKLDRIEAWERKAAIRYVMRSKQQREQFAARAGEQS